jgi:hypothetical protein
VDLADITAEFTLSTGATATVDGTPQVSGTTANDFNDPVTYTVTSGDGETTLEWTVTIIKEMPNDEDDEGDDDEDEFKDWSLPENLKVTVQWSDYESDYEVRYNIVTKIGENYHSAHKPGTYETLMQYLGDERWSWWHRPDVTFDEWTYGDPFHFYESREAVNGRLGGRDFMYCLVSQRAVISISEITGVDTILGREVTVREGIFGKFWMDDEYNVCLKAEMDAGDTQVYFEVTQWDETAEDLPEGVVLPEEEE